MSAERLVNGAPGLGTVCHLGPQERSADFADSRSVTLVAAEIGDRNSSTLENPQFSQMTELWSESMVNSPPMYSSPPFGQLPSQQLAVLGASAAYRKPSVRVVPKINQVIR
jgi:hypothetical protein